MAERIRGGVLRPLCVCLGELSERYDTRYSIVFLRRIPFIGATLLTHLVPAPDLRYETTVSTRNSASAYTFGVFVNVKYIKG